MPRRFEQLKPARLKVWQLRRTLRQDKQKAPEGGISETFTTSHLLLIGSDGRSAK